MGGRQIMPVTQLPDPRIQNAIYTSAVCLSLWHHWQSIEHILKVFITRFWFLLAWRVFFLRLKYPYTMGSITELAQAKMYKNFSTLISMCEKECLSATNLEKLQKNLVLFIRKENALNNLIMNVSFDSSHIFVFWFLLFWSL